MRIAFWLAAAGAGILALAAAVLTGAHFLNTCTPRGAIAPALPDATAAPGVAINPEGTTNWRARTLIDLAAMRQILWDHTPIPFDAENDRYRQWAIKGFAAAEARANKVVNYAGYIATLSAYANGFKDPNITVDLTGAAPPARHPGFLASASGDGAIVFWRADEDGAPRLGARIVSCDGKDIPTLLRERVFPFHLIAELAGDRRRAVTALFLDRSNPFGAAPQSCVFDEGGLIEERVLEWRDAPYEDDSWWIEFEAAGAGPATQWGLTKPALGVYWIGAPTFSQGAQSSPKFDALVRQIGPIGRSMRNAKAVVIDLRGNGGGASWRAERLAEAIFSKELLDAHRSHARKTAFDWRGSDANADYWAQEAVRREDKFGLLSVYRAKSLFLAWRMRKTARASTPIWREGACRPAASGWLASSRLRAASPFPAKVYVLSDGACAAQCLKFVDRALMIPGVKLVGADTSGEAPYRTPRAELLPSGLAEFGFPQKVFLGSGRSALQSYKADIPYDGPWDDASVRAWTLRLVAQGR